MEEEYDYGSGVLARVFHARRRREAAATERAHRAEMMELEEAAIQMAFRQRRPRHI